MTDQRDKCEHGSLRRQCEICGRDEDIDRLEAKVARLEERLESALSVNRKLQGEREELIQTVDAALRGVDSAARRIHRYSIERLKSTIACHEIELKIRGELLDRMTRAVADDHMMWHEAVVKVEGLAEELNEHRIEADMWKGYFKAISGLIGINLNEGYIVDDTFDAAKAVVKNAREHAAVLDRIADDSKKSTTKNPLVIRLGDSFSPMHRLTHFCVDDICIATQFVSDNALEKLIKVDSIEIIDGRKNQ